MAIDRGAAERAIGAFLRALGHDPEASPDLRDTPARVTEAFAGDLLAGYGADVAALLRDNSDVIPAGQAMGPVVVRDIAVATVCPHHLLPAIGDALVAYLPGERLVGIGAIARLVDAFARRLTLQEVIGQNVVRALAEHTGARGAYCRVRLRHTCLVARGARQAGAVVETHAATGEPVPPIWPERGDAR